MQRNHPTYIEMHKVEKITSDQNKHNYLLAIFCLIAVILICLSIYMHARQQPHLGRLKYDYSNNKTGQKQNKQQYNVLTEVTSTSIDVDVTTIKAMNIINDTLNLTSGCLHCICFTLNHCTQSSKDTQQQKEQQQQLQKQCAPSSSSSYNCNLYSISKHYWADGGALTPTYYGSQDSNPENKTQTYLDCVGDNECSEKTIKNYMTHYSRDCNNDGKIDCEDYIAIHILGPSGCLYKQLSLLQKHKAKQCFDDIL